MAAIPDFSSLRETEDTIPIPLNGATYYAVAHPPAEAVMRATASPIDDETAQQLQAAGVTDETGLQKLGETNMVLAIRMAAASGSNMERAIRFIQEVLVPESRSAFAAAMRPLPDGASPEQAAMHQKVAITMPQILAVFRALIGHYTGRPTAPPPDSVRSDGGTGQTSTVSVPLTAPTPPSYTPPAS